MTVENGPHIKYENGFVYLLGSKEGYYKIGKTKDVNKRFKLLSIQLPFKMELLHVIPSNAYSMAEREMHWLFSSCRVNGEWFVLDEYDVDFIKSYDNMDFSSDPDYRGWP